MLTSKLGSKVRRQALEASSTTTACSFGGAMIPLTPVVLFRVGWAGPAAAAISLATIGLALGRMLTAHSLLWAMPLLSGGAAIALAGVLLHIVP